MALRKSFCLHFLFCKIWYYYYPVIIGADVGRVREGKNKIWGELKKKNNRKDLEEINKIMFFENSG